MGNNIFSFLFKNQSKQIECVSPTHPSSLGTDLHYDQFFNISMPDRFRNYKIIWVRPKQLAQKNECLFISNGIDTMDICQNEIGSCWILAILQNCANNLKLWCTLTNPFQSFNTSAYCGKFVFYFPGVDELQIIDDLLPYSVANQSLVCTYNRRDPYEFWVPLMEKSIVKRLCGSYRVCDNGGHFHKSLGLIGYKKYAEFFNLRRNQNTIIQLLESYDKKNTIIGLSFLISSGNPQNLIAPKNISSNHAYTVLDVKKISGQFCVHVHNPWSLGPEVQSQAPIKDTNPNDGHFWLTFDELCNSFNKIEIYTLRKDVKLSPWMVEQGKYYNHDEVSIYLDSNDCVSTCNVILCCDNLTKPAYFLYKNDEFVQEMNSPFLILNIFTKYTLKFKHTFSECIIYFCKI